jgi:hypothetical protein
VFQGCRLGLEVPDLLARINPCLLDFVRNNPDTNLAVRLAGIRGLVPIVIHFVLTGFACFVTHHRWGNPTGRAGAGQA